MSCERVTCLPLHKLERPKQSDIPQMVFHKGIGIVTILRNSLQRGAQSGKRDGLA